MIPLRNLIQNMTFMGNWTHRMINGQTIPFILCIMILFLMNGTASAAYSDHYSRKSSAAGSANTTLKYGGTYGQAGRNYINNRDNWSTPGPVIRGNRRTPTTAKERTQSRQLINKTNNMIKSIYGKPNRFGPWPQNIGRGQKRQIGQTIQQSNDLIQRINNDPRLR